MSATACRRAARGGAARRGGAGAPAQLLVDHGRLRARHDSAHAAGGQGHGAVRAQLDAPDDAAPTKATLQTALTSKSFDAATAPAQGRTEHDRP